MANKDIEEMFYGKNAKISLIQRLYAQTFEYACSQKLSAVNAPLKELLFPKSRHTGKVLENKNLCTNLQ